MSVSAGAQEGQKRALDPLSWSCELLLGVGAGNRTLSEQATLLTTEPPFQHWDTQLSLWSPDINSKPQWMAVRSVRLLLLF